MSLVIDWLIDLPIPPSIHPSIHLYRMPTTQYNVPVMSLKLQELRSYPKVPWTCVKISYTVGDHYQPHALRTRRRTTGGCGFAGTIRAVVWMSYPYTFICCISNQCDRQYLKRTWSWGSVPLTSLGWWPKNPWDPSIPPFHHTGVSGTCHWQGAHALVNNFLPMIP